MSRKQSNFGSDQNVDHMTYKLQWHTLFFLFFFFWEKAATRIYIAKAAKHLKFLQTTRRKQKSIIGFVAKRHLSKTQHRNPQKKKKPYNCRKYKEILDAAPFGWLGRSPQHSLVPCCSHLSSTWAFLLSSITDYIRNLKSYLFELLLLPLYKQSKRNPFQ